MLSSRCRVGEKGGRAREVNGYIALYCTKTTVYGLANGLKESGKAELGGNGGRAVWTNVLCGLCKPNWGCTA